MSRLNSVAEPPAIEVTMWPINSVKPYPKNARKRTPKAIEKIATSIREFGFVQPIVVDRDGVIIIGHGRFDAAQFLKMEFVPVYVAANLSSAKVKALRLADNRTHEESEWDLDLLGPELLDLKLEMIDLSVTGFEIDEIITGVFGEQKKKPKNASAMDGLEFKVVVDCIDEQHQAMLLAKFKDDGLKCRALIS